MSRKSPKYEMISGESSASDDGNFVKTPVPLSKSPTQAQKSPSIRNMTQTVIVSLKEAVTHDITYGLSKPVEEEIDYELQKDDDYNDQIDEQSSMDEEEDDEDDGSSSEITSDSQIYSVTPHIQLPCDVAGSRSSVVLMWKKNESIIFQDAHIFSTFDANRFILNGTSLIIKHLEESDSGMYKCMIIGGKGRVEITHTLKVSDNRPQIVSLTANKPTTNYTSGDKLELTCIATGEPEPKITWGTP